LEKTSFQMISKLLIISIFMSTWFMSGTASALAIEVLEAPPPPEVVSPSTTVITYNSTPVVSLKAASGSTITLYKGSTAITSGDGLGNAATDITLPTLEKGVHSFTAKAAFGSGPSSSAVTLPPIIIDDNEIFNISDVAGIAKQIDQHEWNFVGNSSNSGDALYRENLGFLFQKIKPILVVPTVTISGTVEDDRSHMGVENVRLRFMAGENQETGSVVAVTYSNSNGAYSVNLIPGKYTVEVSGDGYLTTYNSQILLGGSFNFVAVNKAVEEEATRIVLTWGDNPRDLDSNLIGPVLGGGGFHLFYGSNPISFARLDRDDQDGTGPETITADAVIQNVYGTYTFFVHNYSAETSLSLSAATVQVYRGTSPDPVKIYNVPATVSATGNERYWKVFNLEITSSGIKFIDINTLVDSDPSPPTELITTITNLNVIKRARYK
jgi:hypothetical protein